MRTTLELPDELFRQVKTRAAVKGTTIKELITRFVENGLRQPDRPAGGTVRRSALPVIKGGGGRIRPVTSQLQARLDEEEDLVKVRRSARR
jgi:hypothetical protein